MSHGCDTYQALRQGLQVLSLIFKPRERLTPSQFVEKHRRISPEANARSGGKWHNLPMQVEPMDAVIEPDVQSVVLQWASQTAGKTEVLNGIVGYYISEEPSPMLMLQPDLNMAETWSKDRFSTMVRDTPILSILVGKRGNTILHATFPAGHMTVAGANSPASLAMRPVRVNLFDEVDRYPESAGKEGDPIMLAEKRSDTFPGAISVKTSTPTIKKRSRIEKEFELSDKRYWHAVCPHCDHPQILRWSNVKWDDPEKLEEAYYVCDSESCREKWDDKARVHAIRAGFWKATAPFKGVRGYHLSGIYSLFKAKKGYRNRLHQMAHEFLKAQRMGAETLKVWTNTFLAETWEEEAEAKADTNVLFARRERYTHAKLPQGVILLTAGIDIQLNRVEIEVVGHGQGEETWGVTHHVIHGDTRQPEIYTKVDTFLATNYEREDRAVMKLRAAGFDTGHAASQRMVYNYLRTRQARCFFAFKGSNQKNAEPIGHSQKSRVTIVPLIFVGTNRIKSYIYSRTTLMEPGPGFMHFPADYSLEWFKQLLMEDSRRLVVNGQTFLEFFKPSIIPPGGTSRNEALDMRVYALAALYARGAINWDYEEELNQESIPPLPRPQALNAAPSSVAPVRSMIAELAAPTLQRERRRVPSVLSGIM